MFVWNDFVFMPLFVNYWMLVMHAMPKYIYKILNAITYVKDIWIIDNFKWETNHRNNYI